MLAYNALWQSRCNKPVAAGKGNADSRLLQWVPSEVKNNCGCQVLDASRAHIRLLAAYSVAKANTSMPKEAIMTIRRQSLQQQQSISEFICSAA